MRPEDELAGQDREDMQRIGSGTITFQSLAGLEHVQHEGADMALARELVHLLGAGFLEQRRGFVVTSDKYFRAGELTHGFGIAVQLQLMQPDERFPRTALLVAQHQTSELAECARPGVGFEVRLAPAAGPHLQRPGSRRSRVCHPGSIGIGSCFRQEKNPAVCYSRHRTSSGSAGLRQLA